MNANELADYLQNKAEVELQPRLQESATMLRQQQAEIEALKIMNVGYSKIIAEYEHKYPNFFFMENDLMGKR
jgi:hypothetical protein